LFERLGEGVTFRYRFGWLFASWGWRFLDRTYRRGLNERPHQAIDGFVCGCKFFLD
jgi:hypothetical protein